MFEYGWDSVTGSGYEIPRRGVCSAVVRKETLYAIFSVVSKNRLNAMRDSLETIATSFTVYKL